MDVIPSASSGGFGYLLRNKISFVIEVTGVPRKLTGQKVQLDRALQHATGGGIEAGSVGVVSWDDGEEEVVVDFDGPVPGGGFFPEGGNQAWVPRSYLSLAA